MSDSGACAVARSRVNMSPATVARVRSNDLSKGDVLGVARFAGVQAAKGAGDFVPEVTSLVVSVTVEITVSDGFIGVACRVEDRDDGSATVRALAGAAGAALTIFDMCKAVDKQMVIEDLGVDDAADRPTDLSPARSAIPDPARGVRHR